MTLPGRLTRTWRRIGDRVLNRHIEIRPNGTGIREGAWCFRKRDPVALLTDKGSDISLGSEIEEKSFVRFRDQRRGVNFAPKRGIRAAKAIVCREVQA